MHDGLRKTGRGYELYVRETHGSEPAIVFIHGLGANCTQWLHQQENLKGIRTLSMDLLGTGNSEKPDNGMEYTIPKLAHDIMDITSDIKEMVIVAHSMGALPALLIAEKLPHKVKGLLLIEPVYGNPLEIGKLGAVSLEPLVKHLLAFLERHAMQRNICVEPNMPDAANNPVKAFIATLATAPVKVQLECIRGMIEWKPDFKGLDEKLPILVVGGGRDLLIDDEKLHALVGKIKSDYVRIDDAEHTVIIDDPQKVTKIIRDFYSKLVP
jgi:pimeloyl-ACP methyl ester carboxylesterase